MTAHQSFPPSDEIADGPTECAVCGGDLDAAGDCGVCFGPAFGNAARGFIDVVDGAVRSGASLGNAIVDATMADVAPVTVRVRRMQMFGPCPVCGEKEFTCDCEDEDGC